MNKIALCVSTILLSCGFGLGQQYNVLYSFGSEVSEGILCSYNPVADKSGNLYGVTQDCEPGTTIFRAATSSD